MGWVDVLSTLFEIKATYLVPTVCSLPAEMPKHIIHNKLVDIHVFLIRHNVLYTKWVNNNFMKIIVCKMHSYKNPCCSMILQTHFLCGIECPKCYKTLTYSKS